MGNTEGLAFSVLDHRPVDIALHHPQTHGLPHQRRSGGQTSRRPKSPYSLIVITSAPGTNGSADGHLEGLGDHGKVGAPTRDPRCRTLSACAGGHDRIEAVWCSSAHVVDIRAWRGRPAGCHLHRARPGSDRPRWRAQVPPTVRRRRRRRRRVLLPWTRGWRRGSTSR